MAEKNLDPTEHKLKESRDKGQVAVSKDLANCLLIGMGVEAGFALEQKARTAVAQLFDHALRATEFNFEETFAGMIALVGNVLALGFCIFALIAIVAGVLGYWGQFGVLFAADPLIPSPDKINPASTIKNIFSKKKLNETLISIAKLIIFGVLTYLLVRWELPKMVSLAGGRPQEIYAASLTVLQGLFRILLLVSILLSIIDFFIQKAGHIEQLKMSIDEVIREQKENEGDPMIKNARRNIALEILNQDPVEQTKEANAVVVNPTHFAVAMLFDPDRGINVPVVCAKGKDATALAMIECATAQGIPVIRHVWLARTLYATAKENKTIPKSVFNPVAFVYTVVEHLHAHGLSSAVLDETGLPP